MRTRREPAIAVLDGDVVAHPEGLKQAKLNAPVAGDEADTGLPGQGGAIDVAGTEGHGTAAAAGKQVMAAPRLGNSRWANGQVSAPAGR